jgi:8-oxo-dGTP pyrophosphatase MutT (NUDIX family)
MEAVFDYSYGVIPLWQEAEHPQVLLVQHNGGHWSFPKGHPEAGETPVQTAKRELAEETGVVNLTLGETPSFKQQYTFSRNGTLHHKTVIYFPALLHEGDVSVDPEEIYQHQWARPELARELLRFEGQSNPAFEAFLSWWYGASAGNIS